MIEAIAATRAPQLPRAFTGSIPDPALTGLYRYGDHVDTPFVGPKRSTGTTDLELADEMAGWLTDNDHRRPFFTDRAFIREFGTVTRQQAEAAVNAMWARADQAAAAAGIDISLPARLGGSDFERT
jgi:hypothetical protein